MKSNNKIKTILISALLFTCTYSQAQNMGADSTSIGALAGNGMANQMANQIPHYYQVNSSSVNIPINTNTNPNKKYYCTEDIYTKLPGNWEWTFVKMRIFQSDQDVSKHQNPGSGYPPINIDCS